MRMMNNKAINDNECSDQCVDGLDIHLGWRSGVRNLNELTGLRSGD